MFPIRLPWSRRTHKVLLLVFCCEALTACFNFLSINLPNNYVIIFFLFMYTCFEKCVSILSESEALNLFGKLLIRESSRMPPCSISFSLAFLESLCRSLASTECMDFIKAFCDVDE